MKSVLDLRPVYHRLEERIRAHVLLCWLALLLVRVAENQAGQTWPAMRRELQRISIGTFTGPAGTFRQTAELTQAQRDLLAKLSIPPPPSKIIQATPAPRPALPPPSDTPRHHSGAHSHRSAHGSVHHARLTSAERRNTVRDCCILRVGLPRGCAGLATPAAGSVPGFVDGYWEGRPVAARLGVLPHGSAKLAVVPSERSRAGLDDQPAVLRSGVAPVSRGADRVRWEAGDARPAQADRPAARRVRLPARPGRDAAGGGRG